MGPTEGASIGAAAAAAVAGGVYLAKSDEKSESARGIAERIASISDEEIAIMFGEKVEEIETIVKEAASDGYNFVAHHKPLAVLVAVLVILGLVGIVTVRRNKTKSGEGAGAVGGKADATKVAAKKVVGKNTPATVTTQDVTTNGGGKEASSSKPSKKAVPAAAPPADTAAAGGQARSSKIKFRTPMKRGRSKGRSPMRARSGKKN